jgi:very-short-patch-repair endonuclease
VPDKFFTGKQLTIEKWINECGFRTELEVTFGRYCVDIYISEDLNWVVEVDGPTHYKKKDDKRDKVLMEEYGIENIIHVKVNINEENFKNMFVNAVKTYDEENNA